MLENIESRDEIVAGLNRKNIKLTRELVVPGVYRLRSESPRQGDDTYEPANDYLYRILSEIRNYPSDYWSKMAKAHRYYDNSPFSKSEEAAMRSYGIPITNINLIASAINTVTGLLVKANQTWKVTADDKEHIDLALGVNKEFHDHVDSSDLISTRIQGTHQAFIGGLGHISVTRNPDELGEKYVSSTGHREEFFHDLSNRHHRMANPRWTFRRVFVGLDEIDFYIPGGRRIAELAGEYFQNPGEFYQGLEFPEPAMHREFGDDPNGFMGGGHPDVLWQSEQEKVGVIEGYYDVPYYGLIMEFPDGSKRMYNQYDPMDMLMVNDPSVRTYKGMTKRTRQFWYIGPYRIADRWSPHPYKGAPWTPIVGARRDSDGTPYGLVENMIPAQDVFNDSLIEMVSIITGRRIIMDSHALMASDMTDQEIREEARKRDSLFKVTPNARFELGQDVNEFNMYKYMLTMSQDMVRAASGIYNTLSGDSGESQRSGVAVASLAELSSQTLSKITDNAHYAAVEVGKKLLAYHVRDTAGQPRQVFVPGGYGQNERHVGISTGLNNDLTMYHNKLRVEMTSRAETNREHQSSQVQIIIQSLSQHPELQAQFLALWVEMQEFEGRDKYLKIIQNAIGAVDQDNPTPEQKAQMESKAKMAEVQNAIAEAQKELEEAQVAKVRAETEQIKANTAQIGVEPAPDAKGEMNDDKMAEKQRLLDEAKAKMFS